MTDHRFENAQQAVIAVGSGRGFVVEARDQYYRSVITAAHCLPKLPPAHPWMFTEEKTYPGLLGPLGGECSVWAECLFVDPVGDIAVLTGPDNQALFEQADQYEDLTENRSKSALVGPAPESKSQGWLLSLENSLLPCKIETVFHTISVSEVEGEIAGGMSGSPILDQDGRAIGIISTSQHFGDMPESPSTRGDMQPCLAEALPGWLLKRFGL